MFHNEAVKGDTPAHRFLDQLLEDGVGRREGRRIPGGHRLPGESDPARPSSDPGAIRVKSRAAGCCEDSGKRADFRFELEREVRPEAASGSSWLRREAADRDGEKAERGPGGDYRHVRFKGDAKPRPGDNREWANRGQTESVTGLSRRI